MGGKERVLPGRRLVESDHIVRRSRAGARGIRVFRRAGNRVGVDEGTVWVALLHEAREAVARHVRVPYVSVELEGQVSEGASNKGSKAYLPVIGSCMSRRLDHR